MKLTTILHWNFKILSMRTHATLFFFCLLTLTSVTSCGKKTATRATNGITRIADDSIKESCPDGYIEIPNSNFCVMQFEAKKSRSGRPVSVAEETPWTNTFAEEAKDLCQSLGAKYDLISNEEWMIIARNIEVQPENWSGGAVDSGCLFRGNNGQPMPWNECGYGDGANGIDFGNERNPRAKMILSNGKEIFDFAGNVSEWVDWTKGGSFDSAPVGCAQVSTELKDIVLDADCPLTATTYAPLNVDFGSEHGVGKFVGGNGGYARRGGASWSGDQAGIYALGLERGASNNDGDNGFRCVYRN